jgi:hypothetical protein
VDTNSELELWLHVHQSPNFAKTVLSLSRVATGVLPSVLCTSAACCQVPKLYKPILSLSHGSMVLVEQLLLSRIHFAEYHSELCVSRCKMHTAAAF